ncbi:MAG: type I-E CRISPR-associated protein Cas7/Cse4/CasC [Nocardioidaceae bacterium]
MFVTVHMLHALPLHNLNRDQSGLPKSQFDGGVQRARLSSQALKRAARSAYLGTRTGRSLRTKNATDLATQIAVEYAATKKLTFDENAGRAAIKKVVDGLAKAEKTATDDKGKTAADVSSTRSRRRTTSCSSPRVELRSSAARLSTGSRTAAS